MANKEEPKSTSGYCKAPVHSRFAKGVSGNPLGRGIKKKKKGKKEKPFGQVVLSSLNAKVSARLGDKVRSISKQEAVVIALINKAMSGDVAAARELRLVMENIEREDPMDTPQVDLSDDDIEIIKRYIERIEQEKKAGKK